MTQKVLKVGSSAAVTISKEALKSLGVRVGDTVMVSLDGDRKVLSVSPTKKSTSRQDERIAKLTLGFIDRYRADLVALANK
jgi:antitoxin component of MazEF toxin-antitoxin module